MKKNEIDLLIYFESLFDEHDEELFEEEIKELNELVLEDKLLEKEDLASDLEVED